MGRKRHFTCFGQMRMSLALTLYLFFYIFVSEDISYESIGAESILKSKRKNNHNFAEPR